MVVDDVDVQAGLRTPFDGVDAPLEFELPPGKGAQVLVGAAQDAVEIDGLYKGFQFNAFFPVDGTVQGVGEGFFPGQLPDGLFKGLLLRPDGFQMLLVGGDAGVQLPYRIFFHLFISLQLLQALLFRRRINVAAVGKQLVKRLFFPLAFYQSLFLAMESFCAAFNFVFNLFALVGLLFQGRFRRFFVRIGKAGFPF